MSFHWHLLRSSGTKAFFGNTISQSSAIPYSLGLLYEEVSTGSGSDLISTHVTVETDG
jgi:hypothetical protein